MRKLILFLILFLILLLSISTPSYSIHEPFVTFYQPYSSGDEQITQKIRSVTYMDLQEKKWIKKPIRIAYSPMYQNDKNTFLVQQICSFLLTYTPFLLLQLYSYKDEEKILFDISQQNINLGIVSIPTILELHTRNPKAYEKLTMIHTLFPYHLFLFTTNQSKLQHLNDLSNQAIRIGIVQSDIRSLRVFTDLWKDLVLSRPYEAGALPKQPTLVFLKSYEDVKTYFKKGWMDGFFYTDLYPNTFFIDFVKDNQFYQPNVIPLYQPDKEEELKYQRSFYLTPTTLPIYKVTDILSENVKKKGFLPLTYPTFSFMHYMMCSKDLPDEVAYWMVKIANEYVFSPDFQMQEEQVIQNQLNMNENVNELAVRNQFYEIMQHYRNLDPMNQSLSRDYLFDSSRLHIPIHPGALRYAIEKGYISKLADENCAYFAKERECTPERLAPVLAGRLNMK